MIITAFLAALVAFEPVPAAASQGNAPVRLWINNDRTFRPGEVVRVQVEADRPGYLLVLHFGPDGRLSVLFPLSPDDDARIEAGRRYELRDDQGVNSFVAGGPGQGLVYSALAADPWGFSTVRAGNDWDYGRLTVDRNSRNPEADITALLEPLAGDRGYDYDVLDYGVFSGDQPASTTTYVYDDGWGCYTCGSGATVYVGFGWPYFSFGLWWPWHHVSHYGYYGYPYYPYYPSYPYYPYYPYYPGYYPVHYGPYREIHGRTRGYSVETHGRDPKGVRGGDYRGSSGDDARGGGGSASGETAGRGRARGGSGRGSVAPPTNGTTGSRSSGSEAGRASEPTRAESGGRARGSGRSRSQSAALQRPNMERDRPESRSRGTGWIRDGNAPEAARIADRRTETPASLEQSTPRSRGGEAGGRARRNATRAPVYVERSRASQGARSIAMREEGRSQSVGRSEGGRGASAARPVSESPRAAARPRDGGSRAVRVARPAGSSQPVSRGVSRGGGGGGGGQRAVSQPRSAGMSGGGVRGGGGGGGGGRSRGGRP